MDRAALSDWPHCSHSMFHRVRPHDWHVQELGSGPVVVLLHGTGASTHSWRGLMPLLAQTHKVVAIDLPGHGFTRLGTRVRSGLGTIAEDLLGLIRHLGHRPIAIVGHSAGAAVGLRMCQSLGQATRLIGINPALQPFEGIAGFTFPMAARMMATTPGMASILTRSLSRSGRVLPLLDSTGSDIDPLGKSFYARLFADKAHVDGTLLMMAQWKLDGLLADLPSLTVKSLFLTGSQDAMVTPVSAVQAAARMQDAQVQSFDGFGHLIHEEAPKLVFDHISEWLATSPVTPVQSVSSST